MMSSTSPPPRRHLGKPEEPYPIARQSLEGHLLGHIATSRNEAVSLFAFRSDDAGNDGVGLMEVGSDGSVVSRTVSLKSKQMVTLNGEFPPTPRRPNVTDCLALPASSPVLRAARALAARHAATAGNESAVRTFTTEVLGLWHGAGWHESVSTALLGDWVGSLHSDGLIAPGCLERLKDEVRTVHRQAAPLWERKVNGQRLRSLDFCLGSDWTLYNLISDGPDPYEALCNNLPDDPRVAAVLARLTPAERMVALSWAHERITTWAEAAADAIALAPDHFGQFAGLSPTALGERVRRKLQRLGTAHRTGSRA